MAVITGSVIFLTMTALPESEAATSFVLKAFDSNTRRIALGDGGAVDDGAVDDAVGRNRLAAEGRDTEALAGGLQLDGLDGARPDVEADDRSALVEEGEGLHC